MCDFLVADHAAYGGGPPRFFSPIRELTPDPKTVLKDLSGTVLDFLQLYNFTPKQNIVQNASYDRSR